eukprot:SAG31_NODE_2579_length_5438_cov_17.092527_1_plen_426_part_00
MSSARELNKESPALWEKMLVDAPAEDAAALWEKQRRSLLKPWQFPPYGSDQRQTFKKKLQMSYENHRKRDKDKCTTAQAWDRWQPSLVKPDFDELMSEVDRRWTDDQPIWMSNKALQTDVSDAALKKAGFFEALLGAETFAIVEAFSAARRRKKGGINFGKVSTAKIHAGSMTPEAAGQAKRKAGPAEISPTNIVIGRRTRRPKIPGESGCSLVELDTMATKSGRLRVVPASEYYHEEKKMDLLTERGFVVVKLDQDSTESLTVANVVQAASPTWSRIFSGESSWGEGGPPPGRYQSSFMKPAVAPLTTTLRTGIPQQALTKIGFPSTFLGSISVGPPVLVATAVNQDNVQLWHRDTVKENVFAAQLALTSDYIFDVIPGSHAVSGRMTSKFFFSKLVIGRPGLDSSRSGGAEKCPQINQGPKSP